MYIQLVVLSKSFPNNIEQKVCLQSVAIKTQDVWQDVWFWQELDFLERNMEFGTFYGCNCHAAGVNNEGQG